VGAGEAEIGEHAVAHELGDVPIEARHLRSDGVLIGPDHLAHVLGVEAPDQLGRADQIADQHRQLPPLGLGCARHWRRRAVGSQRFGLNGSERLAKAHDGPHKALAVTEGDAKLLEIDLGDPRQDIKIDHGAGEGRGELSEAQVLQPAPNLAHQCLRHRMRALEDRPTIARGAPLIHQWYEVLAWSPFWVASSLSKPARGRSAVRFAAVETRPDVGRSTSNPYFKSPADVEIMPD
jgi:hypothetical protein